MKVEIPEEIFGIKKWECEVVSNYNVSTFIKEFVVKLPPGENLDFKSGGYIQIDVPETEINFKTMDITPHPELGHKKDVFKSDRDQFNLWPLKMVNDEEIFRAYSMANHPVEGNEVKAVQVIDALISNGKIEGFYVYERVKQDTENGL